MKNLNNLFTITILLLSLQLRAQSPNSDGIYTTKFGNISLTTETGAEFTGGTISYGDYREDGTITGAISKQGNVEVLNGTFFNGSSLGKFIFRPSGPDFYNKTFNQRLTGLMGYWGYQTNNDLSNDDNNKWSAERTKFGVANVKNETNVWSGKWNTTDGAMHLAQIGNNVTGRYKGVGTVTAFYNPTRRMLKGNFYNEQAKKTGFIEFYFEGNSFKGKWGWTAAMTEGNWDGIKDVKNNKELSKKPIDTQIASSSPQTTNSNNQNNNSSDAENSFKSVKQGLRSNVNTSSNRTLKVTLIKIVRGNNAILRLEELYGFVGVQVFKVTNSNSTLIKSFGDKEDYFFNNTENSAFPGNIFGKYSLPSQTNYIREFQIPQEDWNNPDVRYEVRLWHHLKGKIIGPNRDYNKYSEQYDLNTIKLDRDGRIWVGNDYKNGKNTDSIFDIDYANSRALFKVEIR